MAGLDYELESVIVDLSPVPLNELSAMDNTAIAAMLRAAGALDDASARLWNNDAANESPCSSDDG